MITDGVEVIQDENARVKTARDVIEGRGDMTDRGVSKVDTMDQGVSAQGGRTARGTSAHLDRSEALRVSDVVAHTKSTQRGLGDVGW